MKEYNIVNEVKVTGTTEHPTTDDCIKSVTVEEMNDKINDMFDSYQEELNRNNLHLKDVVQFTPDNRLDEVLQSILFSEVSFLKNRLSL